MASISVHFLSCSERKINQQQQQQKIGMVKHIHSFIKLLL